MPVLFVFLEQELLLLLQIQKNLLLLILVHERGEHVLLLIDAQIRLWLLIWLIRLWRIRLWRIRLRWIWVRLLLRLL